MPYVLLIGFRRTWPCRVILPHLHGTRFLSNGAFWNGTSIRDNTEKKRAAPPAANSALIGLRLEPALLARVDRWAAPQKDGPSRPEAIRRLVELGLATAQHAGVRSQKAAQAAAMASQEIDRLSDPSATDEERQLRKRRLIKGPKEFQDLRRNRPKASNQP